MTEYKTVKKIPADKVIVIKRCMECGAEVEEVLSKMFFSSSEMCMECDGNGEPFMEIVEIKIEEYFHF